MIQSSFVKYIQKFFTGVVQGIVTKINDSKAPLPYYHKRFLTKDFSVDGKWESINAQNTLVTADLVSMDSSLPLKKRDSMGKANGDIPKMGMEMYLNETQLTTLDTLAARPNAETQLLQKLFQDTVKCIGGIYEKLEQMFLEALSTGVCVIDDTENTGTGVRVEYAIPTANKFGANTAVWSNASSSKPVDDLERMQTQARLTGNIITKFLMDRTALNNFLKSDQVRQQYSFYIGFVGALTQVPIPSLSQVNTALNDRFGYTIELIDRSIRYEKNGVQTTVKPWSDGAVVGVTSDKLGSLVWATLAEDNHRVAGVEYQKADDYILVSKYRKNEPAVSEYTRSQARVVPVLQNIDALYLLDTKSVQA
jgi:hypothetical protein